MPPVIVPAPCPAPVCNLLPADLQQFVDALAAYHAALAPAFRRTEQHTGAGVYLNGLLSEQGRKTTEHIALTQEVNVRDLQHFIGQSAWDCAPVLDCHQRLVAETLAAPDGVLLLDESAVAKQGNASVGVAPQYCGALGKVANCQVGVYLGYVSRLGYTLLDSRLYLPEVWFADDYAELRAQSGVPKEVTFQTKPELALTLLQQAVERGSLPFQWVAVDALYGDTPTFLDGVAALNKWYFAEVACSTQVWWRRPELCVPAWSGRGRPPSKLRLANPAQRPRRVDAILRRIPDRRWRRYVIKEGSKGPIICDFAWLRVWVVRDGLPGAQVWLLLRRNLDEPNEVKFYLSNASSNCSIVRLVRMCGARWPVELCFAAGKDVVGLDH